MNTTVAAIGHNQPPSDLELLQERLNEQYQPLLEVVDKRIANAARIPKVCKDDATAQKITDMIKLLNNAIKDCEKGHKKEKAPFWDAGKFVDGFFNRTIDKLKQSARDATKPLTAFQMQKAADIKKAAAAQAEQDRLEAEKHANAGAALQSEGMHAAAGVAFIEAEAHEDRAQAAEATVVASPGKLVQTRSESGATGNLRMKTVGEIIDRNNLDLEVLRPYIHIDALSTALNAFIRSGGTKCTGARIHDVPVTSVR